MAIDVDVSFAFEADFADIFEVRGNKRARRGEKFPEELGQSSVTLAYEGLDHIRRTRALSVRIRPCKPHAGGITVPIHLEARGESQLYASMSRVSAKERRPCAASVTTAKRFRG